MRTITTLILAAAISIPSMAGALRSNCDAARIRVVGKLALCRAKARAIAIRRDLSPDGELARCDALFEEKWDKVASAYGDCTDLDSADVLSETGMCEADLVDLIIGRPKVIFASSLLLEPGSPNYVYPEGADARCQQMANAVPALVGRTFMAMMCGSSPDVSPGAVLGIRDRFTASPGGYYDTLGNLIANSLDDLLDGTIANTITVDETGSQIVIGGGREYAWTGCQSNGAPNLADYRCQLGSYSWTTGHVGTTGGKGQLTATTGGLFLDYELEACSAPLHLICVEQ